MFEAIRCYILFLFSIFFCLFYIKGKDNKQYCRVSFNATYFFIFNNVAAVFFFFYSDGKLQLRENIKFLGHR